MPTTTPVPKDAPVKIAWEAYRSSGEYASTNMRAGYKDRTEDTIRAAFEQGFRAAKGGRIVTTRTRTAYSDMYTLRFSPFVDEDEPFIRLLLERYGMVLWNIRKRGASDADIVIEDSAGMLEVFKRRCAALEGTLVRTELHESDAD